MEMDYCRPFLDSLKKMIVEMANIKAKEKKSFSPEDKVLTSKGVTSIINFSGKVKGRLVLDLEQELAAAVAENITGKVFDSAKDNKLLSAIAEFNNIVAGDGITSLNNKYSLGLNLIPPVVFSGKGAVICIDKMPSASAECSTQYGTVRINVAFERREAYLWM